MAKEKKGVGDNMKQYRSMIALLAVLVLFIGVYFVMKNLPAEEEDEASYVAYVLDVTEITYKNKETEMKFKEEDGSWISETDKDIDLDQSAMTEMIDSLSGIEAVRTLEEPDELSDYGLEEPAYTITMKDGNGSEMTILIGDAAGDDYYAMKEGSDVVCTIGSSVVDSMEFDLENLKAEEEEETADDSTTDADKDTASDAG